VFKCVLTYELLSIFLYSIWYFVICLFQTEGWFDRLTMTSVILSLSKDGKEGGGDCSIMSFACGLPMNGDERGCRISGVTVCEQNGSAVDFLRYSG
jgi:hypothetical protein